MVWRARKCSFFRKSTIPSGYTYLRYDAGAPSTFWKHRLKTSGKKLQNFFLAPAFFLRFAGEKLLLQNGRKWHPILFQMTHQAGAPSQRRQSTATTSKNQPKRSFGSFFSSVYLIFGVDEMSTLATCQLSVEKRRKPLQNTPRTINRQRYLLRDQSPTRQRGDWSSVLLSTLMLRLSFGKLVNWNLPICVKPSNFLGFLKI